MQDIDFDEIDRAVSSVTTPNSKEEIPATVETISTDVPSEPVTGGVPISDTSPAARRSSGRFMDVVHPSSDMRPAPTRTQESPMPSPRPESTPVVSVPERVEPTVNTGAAFHWPDPIDLHEESKPEEPAAPVDVAETPVEETATPLESPFLSDAKVEKRPLGAFSDPEPELLTPEDFPSSQTQTPEPVSEPALEVETPQNHEEPAEVPEELHDDLLKLEAHTNDDSVENHEEPSSKPEDVPAGPTSITQQYKEQPSSADEPSGAIFDTEVYNQALVHTPKKSRKALIVVWIAALILVGGGIGAGIYFVLLPMFS